MSACATYPIAVPLNYCSSGGESPSIIHIGTLDEPREPGTLTVLVTNLASGYTHACSLVGDNLSRVDIEHPSGLSPNTFYSITVVDGGAPVPFRPYDYDGGWVAADDTQTGVSVRFAKIYADGDVQGSADQYLTLG